MSAETQAGDHFRYVVVDWPRCLLWSCIALALGAFGLAIILSPTVRDFVADETDVSLLSFTVLAYLAATWLLFASNVFRVLSSRAHTTIDVNHDRLRVRNGREASISFAWSDVSGIIADGQQLYLEVVWLPTLEQLQLDDTDLTSPTPRAAVAKLGRSAAQRQALFDSLTKHSGYQVAGR